MARPTLLLSVDFSEVVKFTKLLRENKVRTLNIAAKRFLQYTLRRFIAAASMTKSDKPWKRLAASTIRGKKSRKLAINPAWKLRETSNMMRSIGIGREKGGVAVGFVQNTGRSIPTYNGLLAGTIASYHQFGRGNRPRREIIVLPPQDVKRQMTNDVRKELMRQLRAAKKKGTK